MPSTTPFEELRQSFPVPQKEVSRPAPRRAQRRSKHCAIPAGLDVVCGDGERTAHLTKLAGSLIAKGYPLDTVIDLALDWNERNDPPLEEEKIGSTCEGIMLTHRNNHPDDSVQDGDDILFDPETARVTDFLYNEAPPREWLLKDFIPAGIVGGVVARGGSSKTQFLLQLGVSVACGMSLCGHWEPEQPVKVLMLFAEDDKDEIHRRMQVIVRQLTLSGNLSALKSIEENLYIRSMIGEDNLMTTTIAGTGEVEGTDYGNRLIKTVKLIKGVGLIGIDPVSRFRGGEENSNEDATRYIEELERVRQATGATILVAHHANKGSLSADEASQQAARGASAFTDGLRWQMNLASPNKKDAPTLHIPTETRHEYVVATVTKSNYTAPIAPFLLRRGDGGYLTVRSAVDIRSNKEDRDMAAVIDCISKLPQPIAARKIEDDYGGEGRSMKIGKNRVGDLIQIGIERGYLSGGARKPVKVTEQGMTFVQTVAERIADDAIVPPAKLLSHNNP